MEETPEKRTTAKAKAAAAASPASDHAQEAGPARSADRQDVPASRVRPHTAQGLKERWGDAEQTGGAAAAAANGSLGLNGAGRAAQEGCAAALPAAGEGLGSGQGQDGTPDRLRPSGAEGAWSPLGRHLSAGTAGWHLVHDHIAEHNSSSGLGAPTEQEAGQAAPVVLKPLGAASRGNTAAAGGQELLPWMPDSTLEAPAWSPEHSGPHSAALSALHAPETPASSNGKLNRQSRCLPGLWPACDPCCTPHIAETSFCRHCAAPEASGSVLQT